MTAATAIRPQAATQALAAITVTAAHAAAVEATVLAKERHEQLHAF